MAVLVCVPTNSVRGFLKKLGIELPYDPAIPLLGIHTEETRRERDTCTPMFITALFIIARTWKQPRCPSADEWIRKQWYIYTAYKRLISLTYDSFKDTQRQSKKMGKDIQCKQKQKAKVFKKKSSDSNTYIRQQTSK